MHHSDPQKRDDFHLNIYDLQDEPNAKFRAVQEDGSLTINAHGAFCRLVPAERVVDEIRTIATYNLSLLTNNPKNKKAFSEAKTDKHNALLDIARRMKTDCGQNQIVQIQYNGKRYALFHEKSAETILKAEAPEEKIEVKPEAVPAFVSMPETPDSTETNIKNEETENPAIPEETADAEEASVSEHNEKEALLTTGVESPPPVLEIVDVNLKPANLGDRLDREFLESIQNSSKAWLFKNQSKAGERYFVSYPLIEHELKQRKIKPVIISPSDFRTRSGDYWSQKQNEVYVIFSRSARNLCAAFITPDFLNDLKKSHPPAQPETPVSAPKEAADPAGDKIGGQFESATIPETEKPEAKEPEQQEPQEQSAQGAFKTAAAAAAQKGDVGQAMSVLMEAFSTVGQGQKPKAVSFQIEIVHQNGDVDTLNFTRKKAPSGLDNE